MQPYYENRATDYYAFEWNDPRTWAQHLHHQMEVVYVVSGEADVTIDFESRRLYTGDLAVVFPHCVHGYTIAADCPPGTRFWGIMATPTLAGDFEEALSRSLPRCPFVSAEKIEEEAVYALQRLFRERRLFRPLVAKSYLQLLLSLIWPALDVTVDRKKQVDNTPHQAIRYVMEHYRQPLQARMVSAELGISPSHLARIFSTRLHMSFNEYVNQLRIQAAQDMLRSTTYPITEVMLKAGFESQSAFNRIFREILGVSPREYRQREQQKEAVKSKTH